MKKLICYFVVISALFAACEKSDDTPLNTRFDRHILPGYNIVAIAFDGQGNAWLGTFNSQPPMTFNLPQLIKYNLESGEMVVYDESNSLIQPGMFIWSIVADKKNNIWIGTDGLVKFDGETFTKFSSENSPIPVDFVNSVAVDSKDNIWFSSCSHLEGGFVKYNGTNFQVFTPDNSDLPQHGVRRVVIDRNDQVWLAQYGAIDRTLLVKYAGDTWTTYGHDQLGFTLPFWGDATLNSRNQVCGAIDYTLSYGTYDPRPQVIVFDGNDCKHLQFDDFSNPRALAVDHDDNIWCVNQNLLAVYNGTNWLVDSLTFKDSGISTIAVSKNNKVWVGTADGVFINE
ncbi:MAG: two-component regulator propeller domain-containing protein [Bacteroidales bacterium]